MAKIIGRQQEIGVGIESSRGVGVAPTFWIPKASFAHEDKTEKARTREGYGTIGMDGNQALNTKNWGEGDMEFDMSDNYFGAFLYALLGSKSVSGPSDSAYTHTFSLSNSIQHPSMTLTVLDGSLQQRIFELSMINSLELTIVPDDVVKVAVNFMSRASTDTTGKTSSYSATDRRFMGRHLAFKLASLTSGLTAASEIPLKSLTLRFEKNVLTDHNLGTVQVNDILNQGFRVTGSFELHYQDRTYRDLMMNGTYRAMRINLINDTATIGASTRPSFLIDFSRVDFDSWEPDFANDDVVTETINFTVLHDVTNGNMINNCQLVNTTSSY